MGRRKRPAQVVIRTVGGHESSRMSPKKALAHADGLLSAWEELGQRWAAGGFDVDHGEDINRAQNLRAEAAQCIGKDKERGKR